MTPWVEVQKVYSEEVVEGVPSYVCALDILSSQGIARELFVWSVGAGRYNHVATADEMSMYPTTEVAARVANKGFYRQSAARIVAPSPRDLQDWIDMITLRLTELCAAWSPPPELIFPSRTTTILGGR